MAGERAVLRRPPLSKVERLERRPEILKNVSFIDRLRFRLFGSVRLPACLVGQPAVVLVSNGGYIVLAFNLA